jgi:transposase
MTKGTTYVGLDAHKNTIYVAVLLPRRRRAESWQMAHSREAIRRLARKLRKLAPGRLVACYEAGPCGFALQRELIATGIDCVVVAPSLIPTKPGDRVKTDRRDATKLAELFRAELLTEVRPPTPEEEAARDLCRCREDAKEDLSSARHRLQKYLLRQGVRYELGKKAWTRMHRQWLRQLRFEHTAGQATFDAYLGAIERLEEQVQLLDAQLEALAGEGRFREPVARLRCFRGIDTVTAMTITTELHGFERFHSPRQLTAYLGLVPSEYSSGDSRKRGGITKAGNSHVRRVLIEAAWHYRHQPRVGHKLRKRREGQPAWVVALADKAQRRLHRRMYALTLRGKHLNKATTAIARELAGFIWAALREPTTAAE